jgi:hypothetical protein
MGVSESDHVEFKNREQFLKYPGVKCIY